MLLLKKLLIYSWEEATQLDLQAYRLTGLQAYRLTGLQAYRLTGSPRHDHCSNEE